MILGVPRGHFYYDYKGFLDELFDKVEIEIITGKENDENILERGSRRTVDEACVPIKLLAGQVEILTESCDKVLIPRAMKDFHGRWFCPKLLGIPELLVSVKGWDKLLVTDPIYFNDMKKTERTFKKVFHELGLKRRDFTENFKKAYGNQAEIMKNTGNYHIETSWEFVPKSLGEGEIILPNTKKVFLAGHCYNVYDKFLNLDIMKRLDDMGIETVTEKKVKPDKRERTIAGLDLIKEPFWEAFVRILGSAVSLKDSVDGIIYISSFSCGTDAFIIEMLKLYVSEKPILVLKFDEHKAVIGYETRLEAFADLLERRRVS